MRDEQDKQDAPPATCRWTTRRDDGHEYAACNQHVVPIECWDRPSRFCPWCGKVIVRVLER